MENKDYSRITELDLSYKKLNELPDLSKYTNLEILYCNHNNLTNLDNLPQSLKELDCDNNPLIYNFTSTLENIKNYNANLKN